MVTEVRLIKCVKIAELSHNYPYQRLTWFMILNECLVFGWHCRKCAASVVRNVVRAAVHSCHTVRGAKFKDIPLLELPETKLMTDVLKKRVFPMIIIIIKKRFQTSKRLYIFSNCLLSSSSLSFISIIYLSFFIKQSVCPVSHVGNQINALVSVDVAYSYRIYKFPLRELTD